MHMTFMQKEFCRHYVTGHGFQTAALMAGYSAHVAAHRGEGFLANRFIIARIQRLRSNTYLSHQEILEHKAQLKEVLAETKDPLIIIRTINSLTRLAKLRPANLPDEDEEYPSQDHYNIEQGSTPGPNMPTSAFDSKSTAAEIVSQPPDSHMKKSVSNYFKPHLKLWPPTTEPKPREKVENPEPVEDQSTPTKEDPPKEAVISPNSSKVPTPYA
jgi:hypothetical protein